MAVNDSPLFIKTITTGNGGNTGNFYAGGTGGGWTFDNRLTLLRGLTFDDGAGNTSTLTSTGANVNLFTSSLTAINLGTNASNVYIGGSTSGDRVRIGNDLRVIGNISVDGDIGATVTAANLMNTVTKTLYFASAANVISMGASTGNTTINHNLIVASDITANANIVTSQATFSIDGSSTTTMLIGGNATSVSIGNTTGTTTVNHDLTVNGGDLLSSQTTFNIANTTSTTVNFAGAATAVNIGASTGTLTLNNPTVVGTNTTQNVFNTVATTLNFAGAATTLNVGKSNSTLNLLSNVIAGSALQTTVDLWNTDTTTVNFAGAADTISIGNIASTAGNTTINHGLVVTGKAWFNDRVTFTDFNNTVTTINSATGTVAHDTSTATTFYHNTPTANFVPNFTNVSTTASRSTVVTLIVPQGGTARVPTAVQVNGSSQTVKWLGGASPTGNASKTDVFYFTLLYVGGTWTVLGQYSFYA
jgi:hypothetical protein